MEREQIRTILGLLFGVAAVAFFLHWISLSWQPSVNWRAVVFEALFCLFVFIWNVEVFRHWGTSKALCVGSLLLLVGLFADVHDEFLVQPRWVDWYLEDPAEAIGAGLVAWGLWLWVKEKERLVLQLEKERDFEAQVVPKLSHDLRVPLRNMFRVVGLLEKEPGIDSEPARRDNVEAMWRGLKEMNLLMDNILETHRLNWGTVELRPSIFSLPPLLDEIAEAFRHQAESRGVTIVKDCPLGEMMLNGDRIKVSRILQNLLDNAIKFSPLGGNITIRAAAENHEVSIRVVDQGPGMGQDEVNAVMQGKPLTTKRSPKETTESFGIGLKIVREFVQMHRGRFWIEPSSPAGAQFCFTLPVNLEASRKQK